MGKATSQKLPPVLVAEDDENDFFFFEHRLRQGGIEHPVMHFPDGLIAIEYLQTVLDTPPELQRALCMVFFVDIKMPRKNGFEVLQWVRRHKALDWLRVIILSGSGLPADVARAAELGANRYLVKYPSPQELAAAVLGTISTNVADALEKS